MWLTQASPLRPCGYSAKKPPSALMADMAMNPGHPSNAAEGHPPHDTFNDFRNLINEPDAGHFI